MPRFCIMTKEMKYQQKLLSSLWMSVKVVVDILRCVWGQSFCLTNEWA